MRSQDDLAIIISYVELEKAIRSATRRYFLARNPQHALETEIAQTRADNSYAPGFFHGAAGNTRALNILMQLQELDEDKTSINYKNQLIFLLFAILDPCSSTLNRSEWLATILVNTLIQGSFSTLEDGKKIIAQRNMIFSSVFSKTILQNTMHLALVSLTDVTGTVSRYDKLQGVRAILLCMHETLTREQKKEFAGRLAILKKTLAQSHKIDITETALSFRG